MVIKKQIIEKEIELYFWLKLKIKSNFGILNLKFFFKIWKLKAFKTLNFCHFEEKKHLPNKTLFYFYFFQRKN
jgi:hypothetical protein